MARMTVTRNFWVDWICAFDRYPTQNEIDVQKKFLLDYVDVYLSDQENIKAPEGLLRWDKPQMRWLPHNAKSPVKLSSEEQSSIAFSKKIPKGYWRKILKVEWEQVCSKPFIFAFRLYFEDNN